jgi:hypothetical protein
LISTISEPLSAENSSRRTRDRRPGRIRPTNPRALAACDSSIFELANIRNSSPRSRSVCASKGRKRQLAKASAPGFGATCPDFCRGSRRCAPSPRSSAARRHKWNTRTGNRCERLDTTTRLAYRSPTWWACSTTSRGWLYSFCVNELRIHSDDLTARKFLADPILAKATVQFFKNLAWCMDTCVPSLQFRPARISDDHQPACHLNEI